MLGGGSGTRCSGRSSVVSSSGWSVARRAPEPGALQLLAGVVAERRADSRVQAPDRLEIVGEYVGLGFDHRGDVPLAALEVGGKHLDAAPGHRFADGTDARRPDPGAAVLEVVAGHPGEDHVV